MKRVLSLFKKEAMLTLSVLAALVGLLLTPPSGALLRQIDWRTLGTLLMMLCVLEGFKQENVLRPLVRLAGRCRTMPAVRLTGSSPRKGA